MSNEDFNEKILDARAKFFEENGVYPRKIIVNPDILFRLLSSEYFVVGMPLKPNPPIKKEIKKSGLFSYYSEVEYDHHAPEYLKRLEKWKEDLGKWQKSDNKYRIFGMIIEQSNKVNFNEFELA